MKKSFKTSVCKAMTTIACAALMIAGAFGINSISAKAATVRNYSVDLSNGRVIKFDADYENMKGYPKEYKDALIATLVMACYDPNFEDSGRNSSTINSVLSTNPYQGIAYSLNDTAIVSVSALQGSTGTGKYVVSKDTFGEYIKIQGGSNPISAELLLYYLDLVLQGGDTSLIIDEPEDIPEIVYNVEIKYSDVPVITNRTSSAAATVAFEAGKEIESNGIKYRITDAAGNLSAIGLTASSKTVAIPDSVAFSGFNLNVTDIAANFMKGNKKVTIGTNVTSIGTQAFYKCKKLKKVTIKSTNIKSFGKKAFGKNAKGFSVKVPKSCKKAYKKLLKKAKIKL